MIMYIQHTQTADRIITLEVYRLQRDNYRSRNKRVCRDAFQNVYRTHREKVDKVIVVTLVSLPIKNTRKRLSLSAGRTSAGP